MEPPRLWVGRVLNGKSAAQASWLGLCEQGCFIKVTFQGPLPPPGLGIHTSSLELSGPCVRWEERRENEFWNGLGAAIPGETEHCVVPQPVAEPTSGAFIPRPELPPSVASAPHSARPRIVGNVRCRERWLGVWSHLFSQGNSKYGFFSSELPLQRAPCLYLPCIVCAWCPLEVCGAGALDGDGATCSHCGIFVSSL